MHRGVVLLVSGASATIYVPFTLRSVACMFLNVSFVCVHIPFILHSFPVIFLSCSFHLYSYYVPFMFLSYSFCMSFHVLSKVMDMALRLGQGTECNKWLSLRSSLRLSLRLSLNNPSNISHSAKEICHKNERYVVLDPFILGTHVRGIQYE